MPMITGIAMSGVGVPYARFHGFHSKLTMADGTPAKAVSHPLSLVRMAYGLE